VAVPAFGAEHVGNDGVPYVEAGDEFFVQLGQVMCRHNAFGFAPDVHDDLPILNGYNEAFHNLSPSEAFKLEAFFEQGFHGVDLGRGLFLFPGRRGRELRGGFLFCGCFLGSGGST